MQFIELEDGLEDVNLIKGGVEDERFSGNNIPEEEPLGGFYEEEEKVRLSKDFARDRKR